jgi:glutamate-1-semialdehyde 2,1-aminomutase
MKFPQSDKLRERAHELIPGGCHTYAKGDDQYPVLSPGFIQKGLGCHVWDVDGNEFIEYGMGNRTVTLGHAYPEVLDAVRRELELGSNFVRPSPIEVECAETFLGLVEDAEMVKFAKDGSDATSAAVRLARAYTGRDSIAVCADQPFFSTDDWYIGSTPMHAGIPEAIRNLTLTFGYNDIDSVQRLFDEHPGQIAAIMLEPAKYEDPKDDFLHRARDICHRHGALFILDEMITGFRWHNGGAQKLYGVTPDLSTFGKGMANGFSVSALAGKRKFMELGGIRHDRDRVFLLSTTHGGETHTLAAAMASMRIFSREPVIATLEERGTQLATGLKAVIRRHRLERHVQIVGRPSCLVYVTRDEDQRPSQAYRALFLQELIRRGVIGMSLVLSYSHTEEDVERTVEAVDGALAIYTRALNDGVRRHLVGHPCKPVFRRRV